MNEDGTQFLNRGKKMCKKVAHESLEENCVTWKYDIFSSPSFIEQWSEGSSMMVIFFRI